MGVSLTEKTQIRSEGGTDFSTDYNNKRVYVKKFGLFNLIYKELGEKLL